MKLFKITLLSVFIILCFSTATAQQKSVAEIAKRQTKQMSMICHFNQEQDAKVLELNTRMIETRKGLKGKGKEERKAARKAYRTELKTILSPEQYAAWKASRERNKKGENN